LRAADRDEPDTVVSTLMAFVVVGEIAQDVRSGQVAQRKGIATIRLNEVAAQRSHLLRDDDRQDARRATVGQTTSP
jgi:hypothetical protein